MRSLFYGSFAVQQQEVATPSRRQRDHTKIHMKPDANILKTNNERGDIFEEIQK